MAEYNEATAMQGVAERFAKAAEELRLTGRQLFRDGIVANDQVLSLSEIWRKCCMDVHRGGQPIPGP